MPEVTFPFTAADVERTCAPLSQATMLPGTAFTDPSVLDWEQKNFFQSGWVCVGHTGQLRERGQYISAQVGSTSVLVVADDDALPRAFINSCRHRGAKIVDEPEGQVRRLRCSYHAWSYGFDGSLTNAPFTDDLDNFDASCMGLHPVDLAVVEGLVLIDLSGEAGPPAEHIGDLAKKLAQYRLSELNRGAKVVYEVNANWKTVVENYSECLHCPGIHPELNRLSHYLSGETMSGDGDWCGGSMDLAEDAETMGKDGGGNHREPIEGLGEADLRTVLYFTIFPNAMVSLHPDYVMLHTLWPKAPNLTEVTCEWLFEDRTIAAADFDPSDAVEFWDQVNREDWGVCELTQKGLGDGTLPAGRYTKQEDVGHKFDVIVAHRYLEALGAAIPARS